MEKQNTRIPKPGALFQTKPAANNPSSTTKLARVPTSTNINKPASTSANASKAPSSLLNKFKTPLPKPPVASRYALRKSKSMVDFKLPEKPKPLPKFGINAMASHNRPQPGQKRPAAVENTDKPKPKVAKPAPYDYKARFNLLNEKHQKLIETHKDTKQKLLDFQDYDELKAKYEEVTHKYNELFEDSKQHIEQIKDLKADIVKKDEINKKLSAQLTAITNKKQDLEKKNEKLKEDMDLQKAEYENLLSEEAEKYEKLDFEHKDALNRVGVLEDQVEYLKSELAASDELRKKLHNDIQDLKGNIRVFCRIRPTNYGEDDYMSCAFNFIDDTTFEIKKSKESISATGGKPTDLKVEFCFDKIFTPLATQEDVFEELSQLVQSALDGYHICVFAYGQTGSGKTYTMQGGNSKDTLGVIPRSVDMVFKAIEKLKASGWRYKVEASLLEIYNETINDLLNPHSGLQYDIRYNEGKGVTVTNLRIETVNSAKDMRELMHLAQKNRAVAVTNFNEHSSRSHSVTKIILSGYHKERSIVCSGSINLVDLAGSESAKTSERMTETKNINKSLSTLGSVMLALYNKDKHVPYRNSKLTYLLQSCLGGNSKTLMFVNISPLEDCFSESVNSLRFAAKVKEVKTVSKQNKMKALQTSSLTNLLGR